MGLVGLTSLVGWVLLVGRLGPEGLVALVGITHQTVLKVHSGGSYGFCWSVWLGWPGGSSGS